MSKEPTKKAPREWVWGTKTSTAVTYPNLVKQPQQTTNNQHPDNTDQHHHDKQKPTNIKPND